MGKLFGDGHVKAMMRKSATLRMRSWVSSLCMLAAPVVACLLLFVLQLLINKVLDTRDNRCGCQCTACCIDDDMAPAGKACYTGEEALTKCRGVESEDCSSFNDGLCGALYSNSDQVYFCAIEHPSSWPAVTEIPEDHYRAHRGTSAPTSAPVPMMWTADAPSSVSGLVDKMFQPAEVDLVASAMECAAGGSPGLGFCGTMADQQRLLDEGELLTTRGEMLSQLGLSLSTWTETQNSYFLAPAFNDPGTPIPMLATSCPAEEADEGEETAEEADEDEETGEEEPSFGTLDLDRLTCETVRMDLMADEAAVNDALYCGFKDALCPGKTDQAINEYALAYDFRDTSPTRLSVRMWRNDTAEMERGPAGIKRVNQPLSEAGDAFLRWVLGDNYAVRLNAVMSMPKHETSLKLDFASLLGPLFYLWVLEMPLPVMLYQLVYEKEARLRMIMKMHGLRDGAYWAITYVWNLMLFCVFAVLLILFGSAVGLNFFRKNSYGLQIVFYFLFGNVQIAQVFLVSTMFKKSRTAVVVAFLWLFGSGLVSSLLFEELIERKKSYMTAVELIPAFGAYRGLYELAQYSFLAAYGTSDGLTFANLNDANNGMARVLWVFVLEWPIFMSLAWYLSNVLDSGTGSRKHWLYFLQRKKPIEESDEAKAITMEDEEPFVDTEAEPAVAAEARFALSVRTYEDYPVVIRKLRKTFPALHGNPPKDAVRQLSLAIRRGECFGLLGPNGAGKTTAINLMTGLIEPSGGSAVVRGLDLGTQLDDVYRSMGVCPQHDLLWGTLTGAEHLRFYGRLKGLKGEELEQAVQSTLKAVNLSHNPKQRVGKYSGGMKRRLSVAISIVGSSDIIYMDEPSTGLDPASRRQLWDVVKDAKKGRAIILTTHSMEEASVLCDRLGIFVDGRLVVLGNPKELTARHGGYLTFSLSVRLGEEDDAKEIVQAMCPSSKLTYQVNGTLKFDFPASDIALSEVFARMEALKSERPKRIHVEDWGVANASLEEVFIKIVQRTWNANFTV